MFGNHLKSQSKESEFRSTNKLLLPAGKCFPFLVKKKTLSFMDKTHLPLSSSLYPKIVERIITKKTLILFICCLFRRKKFLCICICCANNPSLLGKLPLNFFSIPSLIFHLLVTFKQSHKKTQPNLSQARKPLKTIFFLHIRPQPVLPCFPNKERGNCRGGGDENWD